MDAWTRFATPPHSGSTKPALHSIVHANCGILNPCARMRLCELGFSGEMPPVVQSNIFLTMMNAAGPAKRRISMVSHTMLDDMQ